MMAGLRKTSDKVPEKFWSKFESELIADLPNVNQKVVAIYDVHFTQKDIDEKKVNLLFFGNFYKMSLEDYASGMLKMMDDSDFLYGSLIRDVYFQGIALGRKYKLLRLSYNIFMFGLIISVIAFVIAAFMLR